MLRFESERKRERERERDREREREKERERERLVLGHTSLQSKHIGSELSTLLVIARLCLSSPGSASEHAIEQHGDTQKHECVYVQTCEMVCTHLGSKDNCI